MKLKLKYTVPYVTNAGTSGQQRSLTIQIFPTFTANEVQMYYNIFKEMDLLGGLSRGIVLE